MSIQITIKGHSNNGRAITLNSYYNGENVDIVNVLPKGIGDLSSINNDKFDKFNKYYTVLVNVSGSKSTMNFDFINQCTSYKGALYKAESFINMLNCINNK
jgi:hypothetical protein